MIRKDEDRISFVPVIKWQIIVLVQAQPCRLQKFETEIIGLLQKDAYDKEDEARAADFLVPFILRGCGIE